MNKKPKTKKALEKKAQAEKTNALPDECEKVSVSFDELFDLIKMHHLGVRSKLAMEKIMERREDMNGTGTSHAH